MQFAPAITIEYESPLNELTLAHAQMLVPEEYLSVWGWYQSMEGKHIDTLPMGKHAPSGLPIKICAQRGIHKPNRNDLSQGWKNGREYALTIHSASGSRYHDNVIRRPDGTWTFEYSEQVTEEGRVQQWDQNGPLMSCLRDGVPVGVIVGEQRGYTVMGLAYVERYDPGTGRFALHGPANAGTEQNEQFYSFVEEDLSGAEQKRLRDLMRLGLSAGDERLREFTMQVRRERQRQFSRAVFDAYGGKCAISSTGVSDVLQAAHIDDYRGRKSQVVQNGILLRADLHLLYDRQLLGIKPDTHELVLSNTAQAEPYEQLIEKNPFLRMPSSRKLRPDDGLLELHYRQFCLANQVA